MSARGETGRFQVFERVQQDQDQERRHSGEGGGENASVKSRGKPGVAGEAANVPIQWVKQGGWGQQGEGAGRR